MISDGTVQDTVNDLGVDVTEDSATPQDNVTPQDNTEPTDLVVDLTDAAPDMSAPDMADVPPPPDEDEDGVPDDEDNCPSVYNPLQEDCDNNQVGDACEPSLDDTDEDGTPDDCDFDDDGDGVMDVDDAFPLDPNEWEDTDGDGQGDNADLDDDNDQVLDTEELELGQDCAITDPKHYDTDLDGVWDNADAYPNDPFPAFVTQENVMGTITVTLSDGGGGFNANFDVGQPLGLCVGTETPCTFDGECTPLISMGECSGGANEQAACMTDQECPGGFCMGASTGVCDFGVCANPESNCTGSNQCGAGEYCADSVCVDVDDSLCSATCTGNKVCRRRVYRYLSIADFDADGRMDFIAHSHPPEPNGTRQLWYFKRLSQDGGNFPQQFLGYTFDLVYGTAADIDGDDLFDIVRFSNVRPPGGGYLQDVFGTTFLGNPIQPSTPCAVGTEAEGCAFTKVTDSFDITNIVSGQWNAPRAREAQDLTGDDLNDLVFGVYASGGNSATNVYVLPSNGDGTFGAPQMLFTHNQNGSQGPTNSMVFADFNNDQMGDVIMGFDDDGDAGSGWLYSGDLSGSFTNAGSKVIDVNPDCNVGCGDNVGRSGNPKAFDFNFDGNMDLILGYNHVVVSKPPSKLVVFFGNGDGSFGEEVQIGPSWGGNEGNRFQSPQRLCPWYQP